MDKSLPGEKEVLCYIVDTGNKEVYCSDEFKFAAQNCANKIFHIEGFIFDQYCISVAHTN